MISLGIILIILGLVLNNMSVLTTIGIVLVVLGLILNLVPIGGRRIRVF